MRNPERPDEHSDDIERFEKAFDETKKENWFDNEAFQEIISWRKYDESLSPKDNLKNSYQGAVNKIIDQNLKNLPQQEKQEIKTLFLTEAKNNTDTKDILQSFREIKWVINDRNGSTAEKIQQGNNEVTQNNKQEQKNSQNFLEKLKDWLKKDWEIAQKKQEQLKQQQNQNNQEEDNVKQAESTTMNEVMNWFPDSVA